MRAEGAKALLEALFVAYVGVDSLKDGYLGVGFGGDVHAALGHEYHQADGFQGYGFAAGVGAGDDEQFELVAQANVRCLRRDRVRRPGPEVFRSLVAEWPSLSAGGGGR